MQVGPAVRAVLLLGGGAAGRGGRVAAKVEGGEWCRGRAGQNWTQRGTLAARSCQPHRPRVYLLPTPQLPPPRSACSTATAALWDASWAGKEDPSGRAVAGVHDEAYSGANGSA